MARSWRCTLGSNGTWQRSNAMNSRVLSAGGDDNHADRIQTRRIGGHFMGAGGMEAMEDRDVHRRLANLMGMAGTAERAQNNEEAIAYYNRVLEVDPTYSEAWLGKGRAAGWLSTLSNLRTNETIVAFGHAIATADPAHKQVIGIRASTDLTAIVDALYGMAKRHHVEHAAVPQTRQTYITVSAAMLDALVSGREWMPPDRRSLDCTVTIARDLLNLGVNPELETVLHQQLNDANGAIEAIDPDYKRPTLAARTMVEKETADAEFQALGYIVLFVVVVIGAIVTAASR